MKKNTEEQCIHRRKCFEERINTSHWPYPIREVPRLPAWLGDEYLSEYVSNYEQFKGREPRYRRYARKD